MADVGIRDYLKGRGYKDDEITYNNGNVMLKNKFYASATPQADGSTYGDPNKLNQAFNNYNMGDALDTFKTNLAKPRAQFSYDPNSDQAYQSALGAAQRSAQTAGNNATVRLGARGIGNSQQALTTENQIQQRSVADVNSNILPQLINQAYGRFHDQQVMDDQNNDRYLNLAGTYNNLGQQDFNNNRLTQQDTFNNNRLTQQDERQTRQDHIDLANMLSEQYGIKVDPKDDPALAYSQVAGLKPLNMREYEDRRAADEFDRQYKTASLANRGSSGGGSAIDNEMDQIKLETARLNLDTLKNGGKPAAKAAEESAKKMENEKSGLVNGLKSGDLSYSDAEKSIKTDLAAGFYTSEEAAELLKVLQTWAASAYGQRWN
ncbi:hypothetical protein [Paenibacillus sp. LjRoot56]|uniref:hypothetical protein n=1 Tax=Paenibacillus sp. LjRoot56 TaxID=3342333 RepID=UPI003ECFC471